MPNRIASAEKTVHSCKATSPARDPYVCPNVFEKLKTSARRSVVNVHAATPTPAPNASHAQPGCLRFGAQRKSTARPAGDEADADGPADDEPETAQDALVDEPPAEGEERERRPQYRSCAHRQHERALVLLRERAVLLDAVDAVHRALELAHRHRRGGDDSDEADGQREVAMVAPDTGGLLDGVRQEVARRPWRRGLDRVEKQLPKPRRARRDGEADDDDEALDEDE